MERKRVKIYYHGKTQAEAKEQCDRLLSILDASEIYEIVSICVFDIKRENEYRCYSEIIIKGEKDNG